MRLLNLMITPIRIHNSIFIGELFQIEVSDGRFGMGVENVHLYPARVFMSGEFLGV